MGIEILTKLAYAGRVIRLVLSNPASVLKSDLELRRDLVRG
jgi:hypothetical protein